MSRRQIFAGNWKMYKNFDEARILVEGLIKNLKGNSEREYVIFPPAVYLQKIYDITKGSPVKIGIQNVYYKHEGAYTGEISIDMAKDCGCDYVLVGHSERRHIFGEENSEINMKLNAVLQEGLIPVLCIGELLEERENGRTEDVLRSQIYSAFEGMTPENALKTILAYEPVWAIGTGKVATPEIAKDAHITARKILNELYGDAVARSVSILYGGSVKPDNIEGLYVIDDIDGVLVGGASLDIDSFADICSVGN